MTKAVAICSCCGIQKPLQRRLRMVQVRQLCLLLPVNPPRPKPLVRRLCLRAFTGYDLWL